MRLTTDKRYKSRLALRGKTLIVSNRLLFSRTSSSNMHRDENAMLIECSIDQEGIFAGTQFEAHYARQRSMTEEGIMAGVTRTKLVKAGDWRTLESGWNANFSCQFFLPAGAKIKLRKGLGWFGWNSQEQTLDGVTPKVINVGGVIYSRVQMKVAHDVEVSYLYIPVGP